MTSSPTQRSLKHLRDLGFAAEVVEKWIPRANIRKDLFDIIDIVALDERGRVAWVQTTSYSNMAARRTKMRGAPIFPFLSMNNNRAVLHGWQKKNGRWQVKEEVVTA